MLIINPATSILVLSGRNGTRRKDCMERLLLKPAEFAEAIGVSRSRGYELIERGEVPSVRIGNSVRVPVDALKKWSEQRLASESTAS